MHPNRILRESEVRECTGLSRTTRWRLIRSNKFPAPVHISDHAVGWKESDIQAWIEARTRASSAKAS
ncbi:helix-turn-helix transcriptional regulator [Microvirga sp. RSM25]|uniref:helix-turn-helix transcriptional regulator n=1 Tax=Microvirga sp. RSM25 TaxID=3273802 RepID=UPI00384CF4D9